MTLKGVGRLGNESGKQCFEEVSALASHDEVSAAQAIKSALSGPGNWAGQRGWGYEEGFAEALATAAIEGLRVYRKNNGEPLFSLDRQNKMSDCCEEMDDLRYRLNFVMDSLAGKQDWIDEKASSALYYTIRSIEKDLQGIAESVGELPA
jgi:hypothetical protein